QELPNKKRLEFFEKDAIAWTGTYELHDFYKTLLELRTKNPALDALDTETHRITTTDHKNIFTYLRKKGEKEVLVILNLSKNASRFDINDLKLTGKFRNIFSAAENDFTSEKSFEMQPWEYLVYKK
ncbi:MAG TPA: alpha-glucosidase C-terminal domain-containing protein, partial [Chitinophagaceae bacterium]